MEFSEEEIEEFKNEASEFLDEVERVLLSLEKGGIFADSYDAVFRIFHSLKGGAGMLGLLELQSHMHQMESQYQQCKGLSALSKGRVNYFLSGTDVARNILHGKKIFFEYKLPEDLPLQTSENEKSSPNVSEPKLIVQSPELKVLVIDDEPEIVDNLQIILREAGFNTIGLSSTKDLIPTLKREKPSVIFTDIRIDELSGFEVLNLVYNWNPDVPVIFISGYVTKEVVIEALRLGIFAVIEKPFSDTRIIEVCTNAGKKFHLNKILNKVTSFIYYQYAELEKYTEVDGRDWMRQILQSEIRALVDAKQKLKSMHKLDLRS